MNYGPSLLSQREYHDGRHAHASRGPSGSSAHGANNRGFSGDSGQSGLSYEVETNPSGYFHATLPNSGFPGQQLAPPYTGEQDMLSGLSRRAEPGLYRAFPGEYSDSSSQAHQWQQSPHAISAPYSSSPSPPSDSSPTIPLILNSNEPQTPLMTAEEHVRQEVGLRPEQPATLWSLPDPLPGDRPHITLKNLSALAILGSQHGRLTLQEIYHAIEDRFPFFRAQPIDPKSCMKAWQGSIRHGLSLDLIFLNESRPLSEPGKGGYWSLTSERGFGLKRPRKRKDKKKRVSESEEEYESFDDTESYDGQINPASGVQRRNSKPSRYSSSSPRMASTSSPVTGRPLTNSPGSYDSAAVFGQSSLPYVHDLTRPQPLGRTHSLPTMSAQDHGGYHHRQPSRPATLPMPVQPNYGSSRNQRSDDRNRNTEDNGVERSRAASNRSSDKGKRRAFD
ncbi:hypothetical protein DXG03_008350 [Asterophora parasitica]|uniref:Fork-head domain-containing protein n=1 Tax=Asterophora parasitica TaxID=117018 RepID=A0A9P7G743_9AGAR|nr:hypothetical protein DXG03_008350 [Asterophora parasitica]